MATASSFPFLKPLIFCVWLSLFISASVAQQPPSDARQAVTVNRSEFSKQVTLDGPTLVLGQLFGRPASWLSFRSFVDRKTGDVEHWIIYREFYEAQRAKRWRFAATDSAEDLRVIPIESKLSTCSRGSCLFEESVGVVVPHQTLEKASIKQMRIQLTGDAQPYVLYLDPANAKDMLTAVDRVRTELLAQ